MCIRAGKDELESVKNLMSMALRVVVADALHAELDDVVDEARLVEDLHMGKQECRTLHDMIADNFDGTDIDVCHVPTVAVLLDRVVMSEFKGLAA
jgi:acyl carrier protein